MQQTFVSDHQPDAHKSNGAPSSLSGQFCQLAFDTYVKRDDKTSPAPLRHANESVPFEKSRPFLSSPIITYHVCETSFTVYLV